MKPNRLSRSASYLVMHESCGCSLRAALPSAVPGGAVLYGAAIWVDAAVRGFPAGLGDLVRW